jgi:hypothetical protein
LGVPPPREAQPKAEDCRDEEAGRQESDSNRRAEPPPPRLQWSAEALREGGARRLRVSG